MQRVIYLRRVGHRRDQEGVQQQLERIFQRQIGTGRAMPVIARSREIWQPPADVYETATAYVVKVELPGMREAEIEITLDEYSFHIRGSRAEQRNIEIQAYHQMGVNYGAFDLEVFFARPIDHERVTARYDDGFLFVELPKPGESKIHVQVKQG